ncbi:acetamidase/formamidase family protein [Irregularibacter muris]|uniref:Acetamidase/formamidase family protein n=1 Tax=Irregularibacter muris TaxID=1796619 RepID=A0AAE3L2H5_9FIRM|nr:acetamidase/formamidase family protein [Irregularibacter muris]MCR1898559.1 acetamidase/formamidase family protein [Irregularibacter muris]
MKIIKGNNVIFSFKPKMEPVQKVNPKEVFKVITNDCFYGQISSEEQTLDTLDYSRVNPATGPIFVEGADPGDLLKVKILKIDIHSQGIGLTMGGQGILGNKATKTVTKILPIENGHCRFNDIYLPIKPMIGVIGVAPSQEEGEFITATPWKHGGNMDTTDICEGSTLYFPVVQEGALLALGDLHGVMGDGEVCFTGCEIGGEVILQVDVIKGKTTTWPLLETIDSTMIVGSGKTLEEAAEAATDQAVELLKKGLGLPWEEAYILASISMDLKISQVVNPNKTIRAAIPKTILPTELLIQSI